jgi:hypothetical protein
MENREANEVFKEAAKKFKKAPETDKQVTHDARGDLDFEVPVETVPLPSNGLTYQPEHALHNCTEVAIKCMTAKEEDILTSRALIKQGVVIDHLLKSCITDKNVDVNEMLSGDRLALMIALRITGYGPEYSVEVKCPSCDHRFKESFDLSELPINRLKIQPIEEYTNRFSFTLPRWNKEIIFKFLTGTDEKELTTTMERTRRRSEVENVITTRLIHSIISIDGITDKSKIANAVRNMPASDSLALRTFIQENDPTVDMVAYTECKNCDWQDELDIPMDVSFFWPQRRR